MESKRMVMQLLQAFPDEQHGSIPGRGSEWIASEEET
jgi:hypothetical protein